MSRELKLTVNFRKQANDEPIFFKVDGGRFDAARTIKLNSNCKYTVNLTFKPAILIESLNIHGTTVEPVLDKHEEGQSIYRAEWLSSALDVDKKGKRHNLPIILESKDGLTLKLNYQVKVYAESESNHSHWGNQIAYIEYDCRIPEGSSFVDVVKETFR